MSNQSDSKDVDASVKLDVCNICTVKYDEQEHSPKLLPCCSKGACISCIGLHFNDLALDCPLCEAKTSCLSGLDSLPATDQQALLIEHKQMDTKPALDHIVSAAVDSLKKVRFELSNGHQETAKNMIINSRSEWTAQEVSEMWSLILDQKEDDAQDAKIFLLRVMTELMQKLPTCDQDSFFNTLTENWGLYDEKEKSRVLSLIKAFIIYQSWTDETEGAIPISKALEFLWNLPFLPVKNSDATNYRIGEEHVTGLQRLLDMEHYAKNENKDCPRSLIAYWMKRYLEEIRKDDCALRMLQRFKLAFNMFHGVREMEEYLAQRVPVDELFEEKVREYRAIRGSLFGVPVDRWRPLIIEELNVIHVFAESLTAYVERARKAVKSVRDPSNLQRDTFIPVGKDTHEEQISYRLEVIRIHMRSFESILDPSAALTIWNSLVVDPVFDEDREVAFVWFQKQLSAKLMAPVDEDVLNATFLKLDPALLTDSGVECMVEFFTSAFTPQMIAARQMDDSGDATTNIPSGLAYLQRVLLSEKSSVSENGFQLLKDFASRYGTRPLAKQEELMSSADLPSSCST